MTIEEKKKQQQSKENMYAHTNSKTDTDSCFHFQCLYFVDRFHVAPQFIYEIYTYIWGMFSTTFECWFFFTLHHRNIQKQRVENLHVGNVSLDGGNRYAHIQHSNGC